VKYQVKYYDERRNLIGGDEWHAPPGTSYLTIGMEVLPDGPSPVAGYQLTGEELAGALDAAEQRTQVHTRPGYHSAEEVGPAPGQPIFGPDGREAEPYLNTLLADPTEGVFPLTSFCRCGRQVTKLGMNEVWTHSD
jgi:hypothetical protein